MNADDRLRLHDTLTNLAIEYPNANIAAVALALGAKWVSQQGNIVIIGLADNSGLAWEDDRA